jgi:hypothetical protein
LRKAQPKNCTHPAPPQAEMIAIYVHVCMTQQYVCTSFLCIYICIVCFTTYNPIKLFTVLKSIKQFYNFQASLNHRANGCSCFSL